MSIAREAAATLEIRLRILDVREKETDLPSFLGIAEGFPQVLTHSVSLEQAERDLVNALERHLTRLMDHKATRLELDEFPTVRVRVLTLRSGLS